MNMKSVVHNNSVGDISSDKYRLKKVYANANGKKNREKKTNNFLFSLENGYKIWYNEMHYKEKTD